MQYRRLKKEILLLDTRMHHSSKMMISGKKGCVLFFFFSFSFFKHTPMAVTGRLADIAQKSAVLLLAGTTGKISVCVCVCVCSKNIDANSF